MQVNHSFQGRPWSRKTLSLRFYMNEVFSEFKSFMLILEFKVLGVLGLSLSTQQTAVMQQED